LADSEYREVESLLALQPPASLESVRREFEERFHRDRSQISKWLVLLYCLVVGGTAAYLIFRGAAFGEAVFSSLAELIKVAVVPVIALVLGFYYGASRR
jgi:hypothetical protein